jgi:membrane protein implicated in regulation of membrane protease activity
LAFTRPLAIKKLCVGKTKTNVDALIGREAMATKKIAKLERGEIKIGGQIWMAITDGDAEIPANSAVIIERVEGVKAVVRKK